MTKYNVYRATENGLKAMAKGCELCEANAYRTALEGDNPGIKYVIEEAATR